MSDPVKFGIIGIGNMGSCHVRYLEAMSNAELTAVCDINPKAFERIAPETRKKLRLFSNSETFFKEADVEAVVIAVPHYSHPDLAIRAMELGKHVVVEKPIAVHKAEALRLLDAAAKHPELVKSAMFNQRTVPAHRQIKKMIKHGELGKITRINWIITDWFRTQSYYDSGDWRASYAGEGGGVLLNQCPHQLDLMQYFFGMPCKVSAAIHCGKYHDVEVEDEVNAYLEYPDGAVGNFIASTGEAPGTNRLEITAERGRLVLENNRIEFLRNEEETAQFCRTSKSSFGRPVCWRCEIPVEEQKTPQHQVILDNVAKAIRGEAELIAPVEEGIRGLELGNAIALSGWLEKPVTLPMDEKLYADMLAEKVRTSRYRKKIGGAAAAASDFADSFGR